MRIALQAALIALLGLWPLCGPLAPWFDPHDSARIGQATVAALAGIHLLRQGQVAIGHYGLCVVMLFMWGLVPVAASGSVGWALREWLLLAGLCVLAHAISSWDAQQVNRLLQGLAIGWGMYGLLVFTLVAGAGIADPRTLRPEALPGYSNHRFFNHVQTAAIPVIVYAAYSVPRGWRAAFWICVAAQVGLLLFTGGRATMLSLSLAGGLVVLLLSRASRQSLMPLWASVAGGSLAYYFLLHLLPRLWGTSSIEALSARMGTVHTMSSRLDAWRLAWQDAVAHPVLGIGPMHFASHTASPIAHPHNFLMQMVAEWGFPFAASVAVLVCLGLIRLTRALRAEQRYMQAGAAHGALGATMVWACAALAIDNLFSGNLVMPLPQVAMAVCCGAAIRWSSIRAATANAAMHLSWLIRGSLCVGMTGLLGVTLTEAADLSTHLEAARNLANLPFGDADDPPRYWSNGRF